MPKFEVVGTNHVFYSITVEAVSAESANLAAANMPLDKWSNDDEEFEIHFDSTELAN
jgi:hypothetical protein